MEYEHGMIHRLVYIPKYNEETPLLIFNLGIENYQKYKKMQKHFVTSDVL